MKPAYSAADLNDRVTLQTRAPTVNPLGEAVGAWSDVATVWACVRDMSGREITAAKAVQSEAVKRITIRVRGGVSADMRVVHHGAILVLTAPPRLTQDRCFLELDCSEGLRDA